MHLAIASLLLANLLPQGGNDPEQTPAGRTVYLGREIAHTMHWTGAPWLLRATREDEENGALLREWLAVQPGQSVCDLGCGNGYHTLPLAASVGAKGKVYAVDLQPQMLQLLAKRATQQRLGNLEPIEATVDDPKLPPASCDLVLLVDVYHELSHPVRVMGHVRNALRPGGRVVLVEFRAEDPAVPIKPEHTMSKAQVVREMAEHGFALAAQFDGLPWQHAMAFTEAPPEARLAPRQLVRAFVAAASVGDERVLVPFTSAAVDVRQLADPRHIELRAGPAGRVLATLATDAPPSPDVRDEIVLEREEAGRWSVVALRARTPTRGFYAMHTGTGGGALDAQAELVHELGFAGLAWDLEQLAAARRACEQRGSDLVSAYAVLDPGDGLEQRLVPLREALRDLEGGPGMLWLALRQPGVAARDAKGDAAAIAALQSLLRDAETTGVEIALYPHHGFWLETTVHAQQLCERLQHPRLGLCFNLCHFLRTREADGDATAALRSCRSHLFAVTLHGADRQGSDWRTLIRPLGDGDFDVGALLATLDAIGFAGPIGLQGFGIDRPAREHLTASMAAGRRLQATRAARK